MQKLLRRRRWLIGNAIYYGVLFGYIGLIVYGLFTFDNAKPPTPEDQPVEATADEQEPARDKVGSKPAQRRGQEKKDAGVRR